MATGTQSSISEIIKCSICHETFTEPKLLPCIHTFCLQCLQAFCKDKTPKTGLACPLCSTAFCIPTGGIQDLPGNDFMNQLIQVYEVTTVNSGSIGLKKSSLCELCADFDRETPATTFCVECEQDFCDRCTLKHKNKKMYRSHQMVDKEESPSAVDQMKITDSYCEQHPNEQISLYCYDCKVIICDKCYVKEHSIHECADVKESVKKFCAQFNDDHKRVIVRTLGSKKNMELMEEDKKRFTERISETKIQISQRYELLISLLKSQHEELEKELNSLQEKHLKELETSKDEIERTAVLLEGFSRCCEVLKDKGTECDISHAANYLHSRAEELIKTQDKLYMLSRIEIGFAPFLPASDETNNLIGKLVINDSMYAQAAASQFGYYMQPMQPQQYYYPQQYMGPPLVVTKPSPRWPKRGPQNGSMPPVLANVPQMLQGYPVGPPPSLVYSMTGGAAQLMQPMQQGGVISGGQPRPMYKFNPAARNPPVQSGPILQLLQPSEGASKSRQVVDVVRQEPLTASMLADAPPQEQMQMLGERLFPLINNMYPDLAGKITGMLLEIDKYELLHMLESRETLKKKVEEAVAVLQADKAMEAKSLKNKVEEAADVIQADEAMEAKPLENKVEEAGAVLQADKAIEAKPLKIKVEEATAVLQADEAMEAKPLKNKVRKAVAVLKTDKAMKAKPLKNKVKEAAAVLQADDALEAI